MVSLRPAVAAASNGQMLVKLVTYQVTYQVRDLNSSVHRMVLYTASASVVKNTA